MPVELPDDFDPSQLDNAYDVVEPGKFHFQCSDVRYDVGDNHDIVIKSEVIGGTIPTELGKVHQEYYSRPFPGCKKGIWSRLCDFAIAVGLTTKEELERVKAAGKTPTLYLEHAVGRQYIGEIKKEEYEGKFRSKLGFRVWSVDRADEKGIPLNKALLQGGGQSPDPFSGGAGGNGSGGQQKPADDDPFGGSDPF